MRWLMFTRRQESTPAKEFDELLDDVIDDFEQSVQRHRQRLEALREALQGGR